MMKGDARPLHVRADGMIARHNPFRAATRVMAMSDMFLEELQMMKHGRQMDGLRWQDLPLVVRQDTNELLEIRSEMEEWDHWLPLEASEAVRKVARQPRREQERERIACTCCCERRQRGVCYARDQLVLDSERVLLLLLALIRFAVA